MKPRLLALAAVSLAAAPAALGETKSYTFNTFTKLDISAGYEVILTQGPQRSVSIDSDDFSKVVVEQNGPTLRIARPPNTRIKNGHDVVRITAPAIDHMDLSAGVEFRTARFDADRLSLDLSAGVSFDAEAMTVSDLRIDMSAGVNAKFSSLKATTISLDASAGARAELAGECGSIDVDASAGATIRAADLRCSRASAEGSAGANMRIHAVEAVTAEAGVGASIRVSGKPKSIDKHASLGGSVTID